MFARLRERYPAAALHVLLFEKNRQLLDLLDVVPAQNVVTISDRSLGAMARRLPQGGAGLSARTVRRRDRLRAVRPRQQHLRVSLRRRGAGRFSPPHAGGAVPRLVHQPAGAVQPLPPPHGPVPDAGRSHRVLGGAEGQGAPALPHPTPPEVPIPAGELRRVRERLEADFPVIRGRKLVLVNPSGGILPIRAWPLEHYVSVCAALLERRPRRGRDRPAGGPAVRPRDPGALPERELRGPDRVHRIGPPPRRRVPRRRPADQQRRRPRAVRRADAAADDHPVRAGNAGALREPRANAPAACTPAGPARPA